MHPIPIHKFALGEIAATHKASEAVPYEEIRAAVIRHGDADWGEACPVCRLLNDRALDEGERVLSVHAAEGGTRLWIVTEHDRSRTTVMLPEEF